MLMEPVKKTKLNEESKSDVRYSEYASEMKNCLDCREKFLRKKDET